MWVRFFKSGKSSRAKADHVQVDRSDEESLFRSRIVYQLTREHYLF
jgi:hypothetical protein